MFFKPSFLYPFPNPWLSPKYSVFSQIFLQGAEGPGVEEIKERGGSFSLEWALLSFHNDLISSLQIARQNGTKKYILFAKNNQLLIMCSIYTRTCTIIHVSPPFSHICTHTSTQTHTSIFSELFKNKLHISYRFIPKYFSVHWVILRWIFMHLLVH